MDPTVAAAMAASPQAPAAASAEQGGMPLHNAIPPLHIPS
jgi:hypothetical protein